MTANDFRDTQRAMSLTNQALADRMGVKVNSVQRWRRDGCAGTAEAYMLIARAALENDHAE